MGKPDRTHLWVAPSLGVFLRKIAIDYVRYGYVRYITRVIPHYKDPEPIDLKIIEHYDITWNHVKRKQRKAKGIANVVYIRWGHCWVLLATEGTQPEIEKRDFKDIRNAPLHVCGYSVGVRKGTGKVCVMVAPRRFRAIKKAVGNIALHNHAKVEGFIDGIAHVNYPEVLRQKQYLTKLTNRRRKIAGLSKLPDPVSKFAAKQELRRKARVGG